MGWYLIKLWIFRQKECEQTLHKGRDLQCPEHNLAQTRCVISVD